MSIYSTGIDPLIQIIKNTSNNLSNYTTNTSNTFITNIQNTSNYIKKINDTLSANITTIEGDISTLDSAVSTLEGEVATNTADIITAKAGIIANSAAISANGVITTANTVAIASCLTNSMVQSGDIGLFYGGLSLSVNYNPTHFYDAAVLGTNRQLTLTSSYANLPTTKNNKITWTTPLNYNASTDTASIDLSPYISCNTVNNLYISSNTFYATIPNYVTNIALSNQLYISSNTVAGLYISSNVFSNILLNYVTSTGLSNQLYISSNAVNNLYISSNTFFSSLIPNYVTSTGLSNQLYISSNAVNNLYISSNTFFNKLSSNYVTNTGLSNLLSSNYITASQASSFYISSNNFYRGSNIWLEKPIQILVGNYINSNLPVNSLIVGDGGKLLINQEGSSNAYACSRIGTCDISSSGNFTSNANISLFEAGFIQYNANPKTGTYGHNFNSSVQTGNLFVGGTITSTGTITALTLNASNIGVKSPLTFTTGTRTITSGGDTYYLYDIDLRLYTKSILLGAYNYRQFRVRLWENDGDFENISFISQNIYDIFMSDKNGLSIRSFNSYYDNQDLRGLNIILSHTLLRNSFNFITYASRLAAATVYMIIEDLL